MTQGDRSNDKPGKHQLFPDNWVIGQAAAALAKHDEGVLLADPGVLLADQSRDVRPAAEDSTAMQALRDEIAALRTENERLRRQLAAYQQDLRPMAQQVDVFNARLDNEVRAEPREAPSRRRARPPERQWVRPALLVALLGGLLLGAWMIVRLAGYEGTWGQRGAALQADVGRTLDGWAGTVVALGDGIAAVWRGDEGISGQRTSPDAGAEAGGVAPALPARD